MKKVSSAAAAVALGMFMLVAAALPAQAAPFSGHVGPTIVGGLADLNGDGTITGADSWTDAYGDTDIIDGGLDCDNWGSTVNDGSQGGGLISFIDDCTMLGFNGTAAGVTIAVTNGNFVEANGVPIANGFALPTVFNAASPANGSVAASDFTFINVIGGQVDVNHDSLISAVDGQYNVVNGWDILSTLNSGVPSSDNGKVDVSGNGSIGTNDDSAGFFGLTVEDGVVQAGAVVSPVTVTSFTPTSGPVGTVVTVNGTGFAAGAVVAFNGTNATSVTDITATSLKATVPTNATDGTIKVTVGANSGTSTASFDVTGPVGTPPPGCTIKGDGGSNTLIGTADADTICGKGGPDLLKGKQGDDLLKGGAGDDILKGGKGFDTCKGGKGNDTIKGCEA